ncbi:hypothetical protein BCR35DRAFT_315239 [Leucosporidium creatinivorum]|uniref:Ubiquitin-like domain-containing protein n=1 Tax=Leucosporidium creatinivorum TaxID=106004 RepID=A0A1Y2EH83_9BASI|nr:hypothetical protein BCR35DRAFT_315239 [Leucosporidium creatinivorum]
MTVQSTIKVLVTGLDARFVPQPAAGGSTSGQAATTQELVLPLDATLADVYTELRASGHMINDLGYILDREIGISVDDQSVYDRSAPGGLRIGRNTSLLEFNHQLRAHDGRDEHDNKGKTVSCAKDGRLEIGDVSIKFHRTLRVPDSSDVHLLPPAAMWMSFKDGTDTCYRRRGKERAVKVHVGGINALSGLPRDANESLVDAELQDYVVASKQPWLDGICTEPGVVRQFVAMPLGEGYTVEEQLTGKADIGGIQFDIFERLDDRFEILITREGEEHAIPARYLLNTPAEISLENEQPVKLRLRRGTKNSLNCSVVSLLEAQGADKLDPTAQLVLDSGYSTSRGYYTVPLDMHVLIETLAGETIPFSVRSTEPVERLKSRIEESMEIPVESQRLIHEGKQLGDGRSFSDYNIRKGDKIHLAIRLVGGELPLTTMGMTAGGKIKQNIVKDTLPVRAYSKEPTHRVFVHTVNSAMWELMTGTVAPLTSIGPSTYKESGLPWLDLYSEWSSPSPAGRFGDVQSLTEVDALVSKSLGIDTRSILHQLLDPANPLPAQLTHTSPPPRPYHRRRKEKGYRKLPDVRGCGRAVRWLPEAS